MKRTVFSFGIFREGMRLLRLTSILFIVFLLLSVMITPILSVIETVNAPDFSFDKLTAEPLDAFSLHTTFIALFILAAPLMTFKVFSFLTTRRESDFYHALPYTRTCLYVSLMAALACSLFAVILIPTVVSAVLYSLFSRFFYISLAKLFIFAFGCFVGALSVSAACSLATSLTGTRVSAVMVTGLILFLPRIIISMITTTLQEALPMVTAGHIAPFFENSASYVIGFVSYVFFFFGASTMSITEHATNLSAIFYTLCLTLVYAAAAWLAFRKRQSETAEKPAPNRRLQAVFRIAVTLFFSLFVCNLLFAAIVEGQLAEALPSFVVMYLMVFAVYCLYELITTRRIRNVARALPAFLVVILLNGVILLTMGGIYHSRLTFTPDKDEIKSVSLAADPYSQSSESMTFYEYVTLKTSTVKLTDVQTREAVSRALADCVKTYRASDTVYDYYRHYENNDGQGGKISYTELDLKIVTSSGAHYRTVYMANEDVEAFTAKLTETEVYRNALTELPRPIKNTLRLYASNSSLRFSGEDAQSAFSVFCAEMNRLTEEDRVGWWNLYGTSDCHFIYSIELGARTVSLSVPVSDQFFPETTAVFYELLAEKQSEDGSVEAVRKALDHQNAAFSSSFYCSFTANGTEYYSVFDPSSELSDVKTVFDLLEFRAPKENETAILLSASFWDETVIDEEFVYDEILLLGCVPNDDLDGFIEAVGAKKSNPQIEIY